MRFATGKKEMADLIEELGEDPSLVMEDGFSAIGYRKIVLDDNGKRILEPSGRLKTTQHRWTISQSARITSQLAKGVRK